MAIVPGLVMLGPTFDAIGCSLFADTLAFFAVDLF